MAADTGLIDWVAEALTPMGQLSHRQMMGGTMLYLDGMVFAMIADEGLWFKADAKSDAIWDDAGCPMFTFVMKGKPGHLNYRRAPEAVYDEADAMRKWTELALEASRRVPPKKPKKKAPSA